MKNYKTVLSTLLAAFLLSSPAHADVTLDPAAKEVKKTQVTSGQIGYRNTLVFYTFADSQSVLQINIDNKNTKFPISAVLHVFPEGTDAKGLAGWVNNQHSCGLFPDVPKPKATHKIPAAACTVVSHKIGEKVQGGGRIAAPDGAPNGTFSRYDVEFQLKDVPAFDGIKVKDFISTAPVYVPVQAG
ncbi:MAG: hypothetical protein AB8D78_15245 [Akkermansiaceae bacterium]